MLIKLNSLKITDFKGVKNLEINFDAESRLIIGENGTGKTSVMDAWFWLINDADSNGSAKFNALALDGQGNTIDQQDAIVEAEITAGRKKVTLKKELLQKWHKKRGSSVSEFKGNTTKYYFNKVSLKKSEYFEKLKEITKPEYFRALSDVHEFCSRLKPEQRRSMLIEIAGNITFESICKKHPEISELPKYIGDLTPAEFKKVLIGERKKANEELDELPKRIDEMEKTKPDVGGLNEDDISSQINEIDGLINAKKEDVINIKSGLETSKLRAELSDIKRQISELKTNDDIAKEVENKIKIEVDIRRLDGEIHHLIEINKEKQLLLNTIKRKYGEIDARQLKVTNNCYACGQLLPQEQIKKQLTAFNSKKDKDLDEIEAHGNKIFDEIEVNENLIEKFKSDIDMAKLSLKKQVEKITILEMNVAEKINPLAEKQLEIEQKINRITGNVGPQIADLETEIYELEKKRSKLNDDRSNFTQIERINQRIKQRKAEVKQATELLDEIDYKLNMLEIYSRKRGEYIEENVNRHFKITNWKLFDIQQNQGIREVCEATYNGVPFSSDLNTGSKINVGIDVIKTLQKHYDCKLPVWVDNAESVTGWIDFDGQIIKLAAASDIEKIEVISG